MLAASFQREKKMLVIFSGRRRFLYNYSRCHCWTRSSDPFVVQHVHLCAIGRLFPLPVHNSFVVDRRQCDILFLMLRSGLLWIWNWIFIITTQWYAKLPTIWLLKQRQGGIRREKNGQREITPPNVDHEIELFIQSDTQWKVILAKREGGLRESERLIYWLMNYLSCDISLQESKKELIFQRNYWFIRKGSNNHQAFALHFSK